MKFNPIFQYSVRTACSVTMGTGFFSGFRSPGPTRIRNPNHPTEIIVFAPSQSASVPKRISDLPGPEAIFIRTRSPSRFSFKRTQATPIFSNLFGIQMLRTDQNLMRRKDGFLLDSNRIVPLLASTRHRPRRLRTAQRERFKKQQLSSHKYTKCNLPFSSPPKSEITNCRTF